MSGVFHLRVPEEQLARWRTAAQQAGLSLAEFVRLAVEDKIADRTSKAIARAVSMDLLPELERLLAQSSLPIQMTGDTAGAPAFMTPQAFSRACLDADLHQPGRLCDTCGGSIY